MVPGAKRRMREIWAVVLALTLLSVAGPARAASDCNAADIGSAAGAVANSLSLGTLVWSPFGRLERGWEVYAPRIAAEIQTRCPAASPGFAAAFARWQRGRRLFPTGVVDAQSFAAMTALWQARRPYVAVRARGTCPPPPPVVLAARGYLGKTIKLRPKALGAYRAMTDAARRDLPEMRRDPRWLSIFSGFRDPASDAARCARDGNCNGIARAKCSAHRTGLAMDLYVGEAPGYGPDSSKDPSRLAMSRTPAYRWLLANAARFGFVNYAFEPWHWEWTGEAP